MPQAREAEDEGVYWVLVSAVGKPGISKIRFRPGAKETPQDGLPNRCHGLGGNFCLPGTE